MRIPEKVMMFIGFCNSNVTNQNDYVISSSIIRRIVKDEDLAIESVSEESNISQASISRFIRKVGFDNWSDFKECCSGSCKEMIQKRLLFLDTKRQSIQNTKDSIYANALVNIKATYTVFDEDKIALVLSLIDKASEVIFMGDEHALSIFYTLQLDINFTGKPAYLYKNGGIQENIPHRCKEDSLIIFISVENNFIGPSIIDTLNRVKEKHGTILMLTQQDAVDLIPYDYQIKYGIKNSVNDGYYSLFYISQLLSDIIVNSVLSKSESDFQQR